jgi:hypothetical protein
MELELGPTQVLRSEGRTYLVPTFIFDDGVFPRWELVPARFSSPCSTGGRRDADARRSYFPTLALYSSLVISSAV